MATQMNMTKDYQSIRNEASKVISDLSQLGKVLAEIGEENAAGVKSELTTAFEEEIVSLRNRMKLINSQITETSRSADKHIHAHPYRYMLGSLGVGMLLGKIMHRELRE